MKSQILSIIAGLALGAQGVNAANILWSNNGGSAWLTGSNWTGGNQPGANDVAQFGVNPTGSSTTGINLATSNNFFVGAIEVTTNRTSSLIVGNSSSSVNGTLILNGQTINGTNNVILRNASGNNFTVRDDGGGSKLMDLALGNATENIVLLDGSGNITISDIIKSSSGTRPLTIAGVGSGQVNITGISNTFTGTIKVSGAELRVSGDGSLGNAANNVLVDGGRFGIASGASVTISSARNILLSATDGTSISAAGAAGVLTYNGVLQDKDGSTQGILVKQGVGILTVGGVSTYTGKTTINNGTIKLTTGNNRLPTGTQVNFNQDTSNFGILDLNGFNQEVAGLDSDPGVGNTNRNAVTSAAAATLTVSGTNSYSYGTGTTNETGQITGAIKLVKKGTGSQTLGDSNSYTGGTTINGGILIAARDASLGAVAGDVVVDGGRLSSISDSNLTINASRNILLGSTNGTAISAPGAAAIVTYNGVFKDKDGSTQGMLAKQGAGTLAVGGVSTYTGNTMINHGTLLLTTGNNRLPIGTVVSVGESGTANLGTFDLNGNNQEIAGLNSVAGTNATPSKNTVTSGAAATLTVSGSGNYSYGDGSTTNSGQITGAVKVVKKGSGTQTFGEANTYSGGTAISGGTLVAAHNNALGSGAVTVTNGGTLKLATNVNVTNTKTLTGGNIKKDYAAGESFSNLGNVTSSLGGHDTTVSFLGGKASAQHDNVTTMLSASELTPPSNDSDRVSDIFSLSGTATDIFVLELQVTGVTSNSFLAWLSSGEWVNAVDGNDATGSQAVTDYQGAFDLSWATSDQALIDHLGSWGVDTANGAVWAVLDHNSDFSAFTTEPTAVPEPSEQLFLLPGLTALLIFRRRARSEQT